LIKDSGDKLAFETGKFMLYVDYPIALAVAGMIAGLVPARPVWAWFWLWPAGIFSGQVAAIFVHSFTHPAVGASLFFSIGVVLLAGFSMISLLGSVSVALILSRVRKRFIALCVFSLGVAVSAVAPVLAPSPSFGHRTAGRRRTGLGYFSLAQAETIWRAFYHMEATPGARMITPGVLEVVAVRR
jgi:hypothetical protein